MLGNSHIVNALRQSNAVQVPALLKGSVRSVSARHVQRLKFGCVYSAALQKAYSTAVVYKYLLYIDIGYHYR